MEEGVVVFSIDYDIDLSPGEAGAVFVTSILSS